MEPQEIKYCCVNNKEEKNKACKCLNLIIAILVSLFLASIGLILGTVFAATLTANLAVIILGAVIAGVLTILTIIYKVCACIKRKCC